MTDPSFDPQIAQTRLEVARRLEAAHQDLVAHQASFEASIEQRAGRASVALRESVQAAFAATSPGTSQQGTEVWRRGIAPWSDPIWGDATPSTSRAPAGGLLRVGSLTYTALSGRETAGLQPPALLPVVGRSNVVIEGTGATLDLANLALQSLAFRLMTVVHPGKVRLIGIDPVGLGRNLSMCLNLDERFRGPKMLHEHKEVADALEGLTAHMGTVIQQYLTNEYDSIDQYNAAAGEVAEPYRLLIVANFPTGFRADTATRLASIAANGPRVGVHVLLSRDTSVALPRGFNLTELHRHAQVLEGKGSSFTWTGSPVSDARVRLDEAPNRAVVDPFVAALNEEAEHSDRVQVPFSDFVPKPSEVWTHSSAEGLEVPMGRKGARGQRLLRLGVGTEHHALVGGRTGSGKTVLLHGAICNLALRYSPQELEFYLVDFKEGVEFAVYRDLPHARVVAIESEREFGLSVIDGLRAELTRRGDRCVELGVSNLTAWRAKVGEAEVIPRIVLIADEFQVFFERNDRLASRARAALDDLARRGRSFGIHVILASQTLGSMDLEPSTLSNIPIRVALQMSESDSHKILGKDNEAASLLTRPGQAIFNPAGGLPTENKEFQAAFLTGADVAGQVKSLRERADSSGFDRRAVVFEGNRPASLHKNQAVDQGLRQPPGKVARWYDLYLGEPTVLQEGHARWRMLRQSRGNLLMVGTDEDQAFRLLTGVMASISAQLPEGQGRVLLANLTNVDSELHDEFEAFYELPTPTEVGLRSDVVDFIGQAHTELETRRVAAENRDRKRRRTLTPPMFLVLFGLQRARKLRKEGLRAPEATARLLEVIREGPDVGVHVVVWLDTVASLKALMSTTDTAEFGGRLALNSGDAASILGPQHQPVPKLKGNYALLVDAEHPEDLHKVRCYGSDSLTWLEQHPALAATSEAAQE